MKSQIRITAVPTPFDPEAFAAVLVAAALAQIADEEAQAAPEEDDG